MHNYIHNMTLNEHIQAYTHWKKSFYRDSYSLRDWTLRFKGNRLWKLASGRSGVASTCHSGPLPPNKILLPPYHTAAPVKETIDLPEAASLQRCSSPPIPQANFKTKQVNGSANTPIRYLFCCKA